ncbi:uncharacterized protein YebE (UPF0316 family) [Acetoanaerobium pronyense]|uniref:UPF0316 protein J2Z35_000606 n=1 Tax=Acetoanaerobium pronyense TaxID=1482736 RepID=A0ABS4KGA3_9FIRM|nr:DUF5698 domain-containing protein [Acetoanaerobium pronyense]MBP2026815.1 uncharacterized protein YebE (UPF0316 family) [Acetoanaerobium pronyense]
MGILIINMLMIIALRICDVSLATVRTILLTKGMSKVAAMIGFVEVIVYIKVLGNVVSQLDNWWYLIAYAIGFSLGNLIGSRVERLLAFGDVQMRLIINDESRYIIDELRAKGFGITIFRGEGKDGERLMVLITLKRKRVNEVYDYLQKKEIKAFISVNDITSHSGGYMSTSMMNPNNRV